MHKILQIRKLSLSHCILRSLSEWALNSQNLTFREAITVKWINGFILWRWSAFLTHFSSPSIIWSDMEFFIKRRIVCLNNQTKLVIVHHELSHWFWYFAINTTAYHFGQNEPSSHTNKGLAPLINLDLQASFKYSLFRRSDEVKHSVYLCNYVSHQSLLFLPITWTSVSGAMCSSR